MIISVQFSQLPSFVSLFKLFPLQGSWLWCANTGGAIKAAGMKKNGNNKKLKHKCKQMFFSSVQTSKGRRYLQFGLNWIRKTKFSTVLIVGDCKEIYAILYDEFSKHTSALTCLTFEDFWATKSLALQGALYAIVRHYWCARKQPTRWDFYTTSRFY